MSVLKEEDERKFEYLVLLSVLMLENHFLLIFVYFPLLHHNTANVFFLSQCNMSVLTKNVSTPLTNELCNRVVFSLCADCSCDAVVLQDGQEELNKV